MNDPRAALLEILDPVLAAVAELRPDAREDPAAVAELEDALARRFPIDGAVARSIGAHLEAGVADGWLCERGDPDARFSRLAKASPANHDLSIDVVRLRGPGLRHAHPRGEVTLGFAVEGAPRFEGREPGWIFLPPGSAHVPEVTGGRMNLIYFLPGGAVRWETSV